MLAHEFHSTRYCMADSTTHYPISRVNKVFSSLLSPNLCIITTFYHATGLLQNSILWTTHELAPPIYNGFQQPRRLSLGKVWLFSIPKYAQQCIHITALCVCVHFRFCTNLGSISTRSVIATSSFRPSTPQEVWCLFCNSTKRNFLKICDRYGHYIE